MIEGIIEEQVIYKIWNQSFVAFVNASRCKTPGRVKRSFKKHNERLISVHFYELLLYVSL